MRRGGDDRGFLGLVQIPRIRPGFWSGNTSRFSISKPGLPLAKAPGIAFLAMTCLTNDFTWEYIHGSRPDTMIGTK